MGTAACLCSQLSLPALPSLPFSQLLCFTPQVTGRGTCPMAKAGRLAEQKELTQHWERPSCNKAQLGKPVLSNKAQRLPSRPVPGAPQPHAAPAGTHLQLPHTWAHTWLPCAPACCAPVHISPLLLGWMRLQLLPQLFSHCAALPRFTTPISFLQSPPHISFSPHCLWPELPADQRLCLALICPPSIVALKIFPFLLCLSTTVTTSQPLLIPSHYSTIPIHNSALGKAGKDKEPKIQDSSLESSHCLPARKKSRSFCLPILTCKQKKGDHKQSQCLFGGWVGKKSWKIKCGGRERSWSFEKREAN